MDSRTLEAITGPADSKVGSRLRSFCVLINQESCIFSTQAATAPEKPVVVKTSRSIQRGDCVFFRYRVKPPSCFPLRFVRLNVTLQFVSASVSDRCHKNSNLVPLTWLNSPVSTALR